VLGIVAAREVRPDPGDAHLARRLGRERGGDQVWPGFRRRAPAGEPRVDLELDPGGAPSTPRGGTDLVELGDGVRRHVDVGLDRGPVVLARHRQPAQERTLVPGLAEGDRFVEDRDSQPVGSCLTCGPRHREHPVAVAVGLDDDHEPGALDPLLERPDVVSDRVQVHDDLRSCGVVAASS
jgi:hypothetical protein